MSISTLRQQQRGITLISLLVIMAFLGFAFIIAAKVLPTLSEYQAITKAVNRAAENESMAEIRKSLQASAAIDDFTAIQAEDLDISKENGKTKIRFAYDKEVVIYGPVSLLIHYAGESK